MESKSGQPAKAASSSVSLAIKGMTCGACVNTIESHLAGVNGVASCTVSLLLERADVKFDAAIISPDKIAEEVGDIGFEARVKESSIQL